MKLHTKTLLASFTATAMLAGSADAATVYEWTGAISNNLNVAGNWLVGGVVPGVAPTDSSDQPRTPSIDDVLLFDNLDPDFVQNPRTMFSNSSSRPWGTILLNNGTLNFQGDNNSRRNQSWSGTDTVVVGDGDSNAAVLNLRLRELNAVSATGSIGNTKTYVVNSDGTLLNGQGARGITTPLTWSANATLDTVMRLIGGASIINVSINETNFLNDADDYVSFEDYGSTFTFVKGAAGFFDEESDVTGAFGDSFRLGGALNSSNAELVVSTVSLNITGSTFADAWQISVNPIIPEPSSLALLGLGGLLIGARRRRD